MPLLDHFHPPLAGQRDWHDAVCSANQFGSGLAQPAAKQPPGVVGVVKFEVMDKFTHKAIIAGDGAGPLKRRRVGGGCGRDHGTADIIRERQAEAIAQRRTDEVDLPPTRRAQRVVIDEAGLTAETKGREDNIKTRAPDVRDRLPS